MSPDEYDENEVREAIQVLAKKLLSVGIKEEMPVFVLKPTDLYASYAIWNWMDNLRSNTKKYSSAAQIHTAFKQWKKENPTRVKEPD